MGKSDKDVSEGVFAIIFSCCTCVDSSWYVKAGGQKEHLAYQLMCVAGLAEAALGGVHSLWGSMVTRIRSPAFPAGSVKRRPAGSACVGGSSGAAAPASASSSSAPATNQCHDCGRAIVNIYSDHAEWCFIPLFLPGVPRVPARPSVLGFRRRQHAPSEFNDDIDNIFRISNKVIRAAAVSFFPGVRRVPARPSVLGFRRRPERAAREQNKADSEEESVPEIIAEVIVLSDTEDAVLVEPERNGRGQAGEASRLRVGDVSGTASQLRVGDGRSVTSCDHTVARPVLPFAGGRR